MCKPTVRAVGRASGPVPFHVKRFRAIRKARRKWRRKVINRYGFRYSRWFRAAKKRVRCEGAAGSVYCTVKARPCKKRPFFRSGFKRGGPHLTLRIR